MKMKEVEMYIGYVGGQWSTEIVEIPSDTPEERIDQVATDRAISLFFNNPNAKAEVAFVGVYNILQGD